MDARQTRELMRVSRRALAMLDPSWLIHRELAAALGAVAAPVKRKTGKRDVWAGAVAGTVWDVGRGILWRLSQERACKACGHDSREHKPTRICSTCRCDQWKPEARYSADPKCSYCGHTEKTHRVVDNCAGKAKETDVDCPCRKYHATHEMGFNIAVRAAELIAAGKMERQTASVEGLETCACGHGSAAHATDALENLLKCGASGCDCDHFHYAAAKDAAQEAA